MTSVPTSERLPFFVYGTLRAGEGNHSWALAGKTASEVPATLAGGEMYTNGGYPYVIRTDNPAEVVVGEIMTPTDAMYEQVLTALDRLETYVPGREDNHYDRVVVEVTTTDGETVRAFTYVASPSMYDHARSFPRVLSGDFVKDGKRAFAY